MPKNSDFPESTCCYVRATSVAPVRPRAGATYRTTRYPGTPSTHNYYYILPNNYHCCLPPITIYYYYFYIQPRLLSLLPLTLPIHTCCSGAVRTIPRAPSVLHVGRLPHILFSAAGGVPQMFWPSSASSPMQDSLNVFASST